MKKKINIYWARRDFRLTDNPALYNAVEKSKKDDSYFLPIFILEDYMLKKNQTYEFGFPSRYFLAKALPEFAQNFSSFLLVKSKAAQAFVNLEKQLRADFEIKIFVNEDIYIDFYKQVKKLENHNIEIEVFSDQLTINKETRSAVGKHYSIFTPFKKAVWKEFLNAPTLPNINFEKVTYFDINILNKDWKEKIIIHKFENILAEFSQNRKFEAGGKIYDVDEMFSFKPDLSDWYFCEANALKHFKKYLKNSLVNYKEKRDSLSEDGTSKISLALAWGLVSARTLKNEIQEYFGQNFLELGDTKEISNLYIGPSHYISELIWREFYKYLLFHNPLLIQEEFQMKFIGTIKWAESKIAEDRFVAWIKGETGYKIVDAAMMQLAKTGWMHNRARMIVASVLTKNLGVDWKWGQEYFRAMLIDLDEASNNGGWQWGASVGADPKPIRIFNPYLQAENYDKENIYQKKWLGEDKFLFGPEPLIPHKDAREDALKRYGLDGKKMVRREIIDN